MLPELKIIAAVVLAVVLFYGYHKIGDNAVEAYKAEVAVEQAKVDKAQQDKYNLVAAELEALKLKRQENVKVVEKRVKEVVTRDVYRNVCLDDDGVHIINEAITGKSVSEPASEVSANTTH